MRVGMLLFSISIIFLLAASTLSQTPDDKSIVPGTRIGAWTLQMTVDEALTLLGRPTRILSAIQLGRDLQTDLRAYDWNTIGLIVYTRDGRSIVLMEVNQVPEFATDKGIRWDTPRADVEAAYGPPTEVSPWAPINLNVIQARDMLRFHYNDIGLEVFFSTSQRVQGLGVFRPNTGKTIWKF